ncbi:hypothetical protein Dimus_035017 [Dionaea muscipula]
MDELLKNPVFATHVAAAAGSVTLGTTLTYPLDAIKTLVQVGSSSGRKLTSRQIVDRVRSLSGYSGLYSGVGWLTLGRIVSLGARFGTYEILTAFYKDGRADNYVYVSEALLAGIVSGAVESFVSSPFELLKLRAQVTSATRKLPRKKMSTTNSNSNSNSGPSTTMNSRLLRGFSPDKKAMEHSINLLRILGSKHHNLIDGLKNYPWMMTGSGKPPTVSDVRRPVDVVKLEGWGSLWRGLRSGMARDSIFGGVFFSTWQFLHLRMLDWKAVGMDPPPKSDDEIGPLSPLAVSLGAGISGSIAAMASHGLDTARSRSQCIVLPKFITMEQRCLKWKPPGSKFERTVGIHPTDRNILFRGIWLRMARSGIASFIIVGSYFFIVDHLVTK